MRHGDPTVLAGVHQQPHNILVSTNYSCADGTGIVALNIVRLPRCQPDDGMMKAMQLTAIVALTLTL